MPTFSVVTERVAGQAQTLHALGGELDAAVPMLAHAGQAAADTDAADALAAAAAAWIGALSGFAFATDALATALAKAAECYALTDETAVPGG